MRTVAESGRVRKLATDRGDAERLAREAGVLAAAAHPGVVRLIETRGGHPPDELVLEDIRGVELTTVRWPLDWSEIAGLGAAIATTLADLHDVGIVHGSVGAEHVFLDDLGRPVLCGFGKATLDEDLTQVRTQSSVDIVALADLLQSLGDNNPPRALARLLNSCSRRRPTSRTISARRFAHGLVHAIPDARLPGDEHPANEAHHESRSIDLVRRERVPTAVSVLVASMVLLGSTALALDVGARSTADKQPLSLCPLGDGGCVSQTVESGSVIAGPGGKFVLLGMAGIEVIGRWRCSAPAVPALLDLQNGDVWAFDRWPADPAGESAHLVGKVRRATGLRVLPRAGRAARCDSLLVERHQLNPVRFDFLP